MIQPALINRADRGGTRERILDAARALFAQLGYSATTVRMIAERAGVRDPALYYYFPTKRDLHDALLVGPDVLDLTGPSGSIEAGVEDLIGLFLRYAEDGDVFRLALREQVSGDPTAITLRRTSVQAFRDFAGPLFRRHFGDAAEDVENVVLYTLTGVFWDAILRFGPQFEAHVVGDGFRDRLRALVVACLPRPLEAS